MGELILIIIVVVLAANGDYTLLWIIGAIVVLGLIATLFSGNGKKTVTRERPRIRIDHPHYVSVDESECTICGRRIPAYVSRCPNCGVRFNAARKDEEEWDEEFEEMEAWDEEEGW